jgi:hypothetical protein
MSPSTEIFGAKNQKHPPFLNKYSTFSENFQKNRIYNPIGYGPHISGRSPVKNPSTAPITPSITPEKNRISKTTSHLLFHVPETVGRIPGITQGHILLPSNGGIGRRLIVASIAFM